MLVNINSKSSEHVKFVSYTGKYPNLCSGILTLEIDGKEYTFGNDYFNPNKVDYDKFWSSGGNCGFTNNYASSYVNDGEWNIDYEEIPDEFKKYAHEIDEVFNENVPQGCCGGCL